jgi:hypothetical protein
MALAKGVAKKIAYKLETNWGEAPTVLTGARYLSRVTGQFNVNAETLQSNTIRTDRQIEDYRLGTRSGDGSLNTELSPGSLDDFFAAALAKDFAAGGTTASTSVTIATSGDFYTITRSTGSWLTDGFYVGNVVRMTGAGLNTANVGNNLLILSMTATVLTVKTLGDNVLVAEGPIATVAVSVVGKQTYTPQTGHTSKSFAFEEWFEDVTVSELHLGNKVNTLAVQLPTNGFCTADVSFMGKGKMVTGASQFYTSPTAAPSNGLTVSVSGAVVVNGVPAGVITSADFSIDRGLEAANVIGTNYAVEMFDGRVNVSGNISTFFENGTFRDYFLNENKISLIFALSTGSEKDAEVISFVFPTVKLGSSTRDDGENGLIQQHSFQAILNTDAATGLVPSTMLVQDTSLV